MILDYLQLNVAPTTPVARLSVAQQQMVEIARALTLNARLIIMDEPSAALSDSEVESLHRVVRELKNRGLALFTLPTDCTKFSSFAIALPFSRTAVSPAVAPWRKPMSSS